MNTILERLLKKTLSVNNPVHVEIVIKRFFDLYEPVIRTLAKPPYSMIANSDEAVSLLRKSFSNDKITKQVIGLIPAEVTEVIITKIVGGVFADARQAPIEIPIITTSTPELVTKIRTALPDPEPVIHPPFEIKLPSPQKKVTKKVEQIIITEDTIIT